MKHLILVCFALFIGCLGAEAQIQENRKNFTEFNGLFNFLYDQNNDKVYLEVAELDKEFLYVYSLSSGIGSNDIGLDRGQLGGEQVVYFKKAGNKLLLVQPNLKFRALTDNDLEKKSVKQAFAKSVLYGFKIEEEDNGTYTIDLTDFLMQDVHGVVKRLKNANQGSYSLDKSKSAMNLERTKAFPKNIEFDVLLTFSGEAQGSHIRSVAPNSSLVTVSQHHSFIQLPDNNFQKRVFHPGSGSYAFSYYDYATPIQEPILKRYIPRHRLIKKDPEAKVSEAVEPIVYYLDNGTPEPVRTALLEGASWWNEAFEAIGFKDAFQVKMLPAEVDPMDVRYNVIQWVHRSTRGWSYGSSIKDPRTGEILKGHVSLGSLRIRQDFLIAQALMDKPFAKGDNNHDPMLEMALARIRQLAAHEIGHTLGFAHNFAASASGRTSVMDYPHPAVTLKRGKVDFSKAYDTGIGEWDKLTVAYAYSQLSPEEEGEALKEILREGHKKGLRFISDRDARAMGGAHAYAHLWDNGDNVTKELENLLKIRKVAISNFSIDNIRTDEPNSVLEDVFVPLYFFHRYQTEAVSKLIGGMDYNYTVKGDEQTTVKTIDKRVQEEALNTLLITLDADEIAIPKDKLALFPPRSMGYGRTRESFKGRTGVTFDALSAPETAANHTLELLLNPERASRLIVQKSLKDSDLGLGEVLASTIAATIGKQYRDSYLNQVQQNINYRVLYHIMNLAAHRSVHPQVNAIANRKLEEIKASLAGNSDPNAQEMVRRIDGFYKHPELFEILPSPVIPDGSPIGMDCIQFH